MDDVVVLVKQVEEVPETEFEEVHVFQKHIVFRYLRVLESLGVSCDLCVGLSTCKAAH